MPRKDAVTAEAKALKQILIAYDEMLTAQRDHKDAKAKALAEAKDALDELKTSIHDAKRAEPAEAPAKIGVIVACWESYVETKSANADIVKAKKEDAEEARKTLEEVIKSSKQGELDFDEKAA